MLLGSMSLWALPLLAAGPASGDLQCSDDSTARSSQFVELPTYPSEPWAINADAPTDRQMEAGDEADIVNEGEPFMVAEIDPEDIPSNILEASDKLSEILTCEDYRTFISIYRDPHLDTPNAFRMRLRIGDLAHYLYESWDIEEGDTQFARSMRCIAINQLSIETVFILAAHYAVDVDDFDENYNRINDSALTVAYLLATRCMHESDDDELRP